jgi:hypothetical protein
VRAVLLLLVLHLSAATIPSVWSHALDKGSDKHVRLPELARLRPVSMSASAGLNAEPPKLEAPHKTAGLKAAPPGQAKTMSLYSADSAGACPTTSGPVVRMDLYIMAQCPFCTQTIPVIMPYVKCSYSCPGAPSVQLDFHLNYVGIFNPDGSVSSMHGQNELLGDEIYLCASQLYPQQYQYMRMVQCMEQSAAMIPSNAPSCAAMNGMDYSKILQCVNSQGYASLTQSFQVAQASAVSITPTMVLSSGGRSVKVQTAWDPNQVSTNLCSIIGTPSTF